MDAPAPPIASLLAALLIAASIATPAHAERLKSIPSDLWGRWTDAEQREEISGIEVRAREIVELERGARCAVGAVSETSWSKVTAALTCRLAGKTWKAKFEYWPLHPKAFIENPYPGEERRMYWVPE
jgi:hypothetical protein